MGRIQKDEALMSTKPVLAQKIAGAAQDTEDQDVTEEDAEEEDKAEGDAISKRHLDNTRTEMIINSI